MKMGSGVSWWGGAEVGGHGGPFAGGLSPDSVLVATPSTAVARGPLPRPPSTPNAHRRPSSFFSFYFWVLFAPCSLFRKREFRKYMSGL